eukprot:c11680_g1_i1.p1 GENE.c11680_g1_i1~~c11680_g1_i1.p1  ORF type:complete len:215 (+),score=37.29 c11680_g1_i1:27-671(+)
MLTCEVSGLRNAPIRDQGEVNTCSAHAFTALHEIVTGRRYRVDDLVVHYMEEIGSLMGEMSRNLRDIGQREDSNSESTTPSGRPRRQCRDRFRLECVQVIPRIQNLKAVLRKDLPACLEIRNFCAEDGWVVANGDPDEGPEFHAVCIIGYDDTISISRQVVFGEGSGELVGAFKFLNSFGPEWGDGGFGYLSYALFEETTRVIADIWAPAKWLD